MNKNKICTLILCFISVCIFKSTAQTISSSNTEWMSFLEELVNEEETEDSQIAVLFEELSYLSENPFNLNIVGKDDLRKLPFLNETQIEDLLYYIYKYGPLVDIYELKNVPSLDRQTLIYILPFVYVGEAPKKNPFQWKNMFTHAKQEIAIRSDYTFQEKAGYKNANEEERNKNPNKYYLGEPYYLSLRYGFKYSEFVQLGIAAEKDAGEPFWNAHHKGFDYYAFNLNIKNIGILNSLHIGDYRLSFGQGLAMNTLFSMNLTSDVCNIEQKNNGIKRHTSMQEIDFFRGVAGNFQVKNMGFDLFYSNRFHDASADSLTISSFKTDGYHRMPNDLDKKNTAKTNLLGAHLQWRKEDFTLGTTFVYYNFGGKYLNPEIHPYNLFYLRANNFFNSSFYYNYYGRNFSFSGETAIDKNGKWATINHFLASPLSGINLILSYRNYAKDYNAFYGKAFGESSSVRNEKGLYFGIRFSPFSKWEISTSFDRFLFPWLRYQVDSPTEGTSALVNMQYYVGRDSKIIFRYKYQNKSKNILEENHRIPSVLPYEQHRFRIQWDYPFAHKLNLRTQIDCVLYKENNQTDSGWAVSQHFSIPPSGFPLKIDGAITYFNTDNWNTKISIYENNILYAFSFPNFYEEGIRTYITANYKIIKNVTFYVKLANTHYFNRIIIGNGLEQIEGYNKTDINGLLRFVF